MNYVHRPGSTQKFKDIFEEVRAKHEEEIERQEAWIKEFMAQQGITLFDLIVDYEFRQKPLYIDTVDDFDIHNMKVTLVHEYGFRKRTPEERAEFLKNLKTPVCRTCTHSSIVHNDRMGSCFENDCGCELYLPKQRDDIVEGKDICVTCDHRLTIHQYTGYGVSEDCLIRGCPCVLYISREVDDEDPDHGES